jgi:hypothetical protein
MSGKRMRQGTLLRWFWLVVILDAGTVSPWNWPGIEAASAGPDGSFLPIGSAARHEQFVTKGFGPVVSPDGRVYFTADMDDLEQTG